MAPARKGRSRTAAAAAEVALAVGQLDITFRSVIEIPDTNPRSPGATVLSAKGQAEKMVLKGGRAAWVPLRSGVKLRLPHGRSARLGSVTKMGIGGFNGGQAAAPFALRVKYGSVAVGRNRGPTGAAKSAATHRSGQSLLPAGGAKLTPAARGRVRFFPMVKAGSKLTRLSRASRGVAKLSRMDVTKPSAVGMVTHTGARGVQAASAGGTAGTYRWPRPSRLGR